METQVQAECRLALYQVFALEVQDILDAHFSQGVYSQNDVVNHTADAFARLTDDLAKL